MEDRGCDGARVSRGDPRRGAQEQPGRAGVGPVVVVRARADDDVGVAVPVGVPGGADAEVVVCPVAVQGGVGHRAGVAAGDPRGRAQEDEGRAGVSPVAVGPGGLDHEVGVAVAVDVARRGSVVAQPIPREVAGQDGVGDRAGGAAGDARGRAQEDEDRARVPPVGVVEGHGHRQVAIAVTVDVARRGDPPPERVAHVVPEQDGVRGRAGVPSRDPGGRAQEEERGAGVRPAAVAVGRPHHHVAVAVPVDVTRRGRGEAEVVPRRVPQQHRRRCGQQRVHHQRQLRPDDRDPQLQPGSDHRHARGQLPPGRVPGHEPPVVQGPVRQARRPTVPVHDRCAGALHHQHQLLASARQLGHSPPLLQALGAVPPPLGDPGALVLHPAHAVTLHVCVGLVRAAPEGRRRFRNVLQRLVHAPPGEAQPQRGALRPPRRHQLEP